MFSILVCTLLFCRNLVSNLQWARHLGSKLQRRKWAFTFILALQSCHIVLFLFILWVSGLLPNTLLRVKLLIEQVNNNVADLFKYWDADSKNVLMLECLSFCFCWNKTFILPCSQFGWQYLASLSGMETLDGIDYCPCFVTYLLCSLLRRSYGGPLYVITWICLASNGRLRGSAFSPIGLYRCSNPMKYTAITWIGLMLWSNFLAKAAWLDTCLTIMLDFELRF